MKTHRPLFCLLGLLSTLPVCAADFDIRNEAEFKKCVSASAKVEKLAGDMNFLEGPQWVPADGGYLVFSDVPGNELKKWTAAGGITSFRKPSQNVNGNTLDVEGRLVSCEHAGRRIVVAEKNGSLRTVVDRYNSKKLNSPNDVAVKSDGTIWFTDPPYGLPMKADKSGREGKEQDAHHVFRFDPKKREIKAVISDCDMPNGLCFSPDEKKLYVADSGAPKHIRVFEVQKDGSLANGKVFCKIDKGGPDGIRADTEGRVWSSAGDGVHIFAPDGSLVGKILVPETPANLAFGGKDGRTVFITARKSLYKIDALVAGAKWN